MLKLLDIFWLAFNKVIEHTPALWDDNPYWTYQLHADIVQALRKGDEAEAGKALNAHHAGIEIRLERTTLSGSTLNVDPLSFSPEFSPYAALNSAGSHNNQ